MRRTIICCLCLALWFTLTSLHQGSVAHAGDLLRPGCCEYFSEADFVPFEPGKLVLPSVDFVSASSSASFAKGNSVELDPVLLTFIPKSVRTWNFDYQPSKTLPVTLPAEAQPRIKLLWHTQKVSFRPKSTIIVPVRSQKKHVAPVLFWGTGSMADVTIAVRLITQQFGRILYLGSSPASQLPFRIVRIVNHCF